MVWLVWVLHRVVRNGPESAKTLHISMKEGTYGFIDTIIDVVDQPSTHWLGAVRRRLFSS